MRILETGLQQTPNHENQIVMKQTTLDKLMLLYEEFQRLADELYIASEIVMENEDFDDASLLASQADKLYVEAENLMSLISELEK